MYKFSRDVIFEVFAVNWPSAKFSSLKFHWQNFGLHQLESRILSTATRLRLTLVRDDSKPFVALATTHVIKCALIQVVIIVVRLSKLRLICDFVEENWRKSL